jgi:curli biogenesis system outer membrane secretion channel CsgG
MNRRTLTVISVVVLCAMAACMWLVAQKVSAQNAVALASPVYNPYPPGDCPVEYRFRASQGSGGSGFHRKSSDCPMAGPNAPDSDGSAPNTAEYGN